MSVKSITCWGKEFQILIADGKKECLYEFKHVVGNINLLLWLLVRWHLVLVQKIAEGVVKRMKHIIRKESWYFAMNLGIYHTHAMISVYTTQAQHQLVKKRSKKKKDRAVQCRAIEKEKGACTTIEHLRHRVSNWWLIATEGTCRYTKPHTQLIMCLVAPKD